MRAPRRKRTGLPPWLKPLAALIPVALVAAMVAGAPAIDAALGRGERGGAFQSGYDRLVNAIAQRQWLAVTYGEDGEMSVGLRPGAIGADPRLRDFVNNSYLRDDFADPSIWTLSDDGLWVQGIDPYAHRIDRPLSDGGVWRGDLQFRSGSRHAVTLVDVADPDREPLQFEASGAPAGACDITMPARQVEPSGPRRAFSICVRDGLAPARAVASLLLVGDRLMVRVQNVAPLEIRVGQRDASPKVDGAVSLTPVEPGEVLSLRWNRARLRLQLRGGAQDISRLQANGARTYHPGLQAMAQAVENGLQGQPDRPVRLSLDARLQAVAQAALETQANAIRAAAEPGAVADPGDAFKASVTVMDPISGQVLAAATYPVDDRDLSPAQRRTKRGQSMVARNHNFDRMAIGSMAKAPFALAILDADPGLATLKLQGGPKARIRTVLGMDLGKGGFDNHEFGLTDFPSFLEHSNNRYALALMMLAYRQPGAPEPAPRAQAPWTESWSLEGRTRTDAPPLPVYGDAPGPGPFGWVLRPPAGSGLAWPERLGRIFTVDSGQAAGCRYEVGVWRGLGGRTPACDSAFAGASPEREQLGLNAISSFHTDYLMSVLGGGRSTWSAIKVAEVYSRIVTGRMVRARMTMGVPGPDEARPLPMRHPQVRATVVDGLGRVVKTGTAAWLGRQFATMGYAPDVRLFGKTGTMKVAGEVAVDPAAVILRDLATHDCGLRWDPQAGVLKFGSAVPRSRDEAARQILGLKETRCRVRVAGRKAVAEQVAAEMQRHACGYRNCPPTGFTPLADGRVVDLPVRETAEPDLVDGHGIAVVAAKFAGERPVRGLTIVVNIQDKRQTEVPALAVADAVLRSVAAHEWIERGPWP